jgi:Raf kinase inhibitor-like YbhB/YbcL family protein
VSLSLASAEFRNGQSIPAKYTCDGLNVSVPLQWADPPASSKSYALILDDPDAPSGTFVHWVLYNVPASVHNLTENIPTDATLPDGSMNGQNGARRSGYTGPCPPSGTHHYHFKLYALDSTLPLKPGATKDQLTAAMQGHILAQAELIGTYQHGQK